MRHVDDQGTPAEGLAGIQAFDRAFVPAALSDRAVSNLPLIVAVLAGAAGKFLDGSAHSYAASVSYLAMTIWAYEELVHGVNWFRRLLGLGFVIFLIVHVAQALPAS